MKLNIDTRRACYVRTGKLRESKQALFHGWANLIDNNHRPRVDFKYITMGIVEYDNGVVATVHPERIIFADGGGFGDYCWLPLEALYRIKEEPKNETMD